MRTQALGSLVYWDWLLVECLCQDLGKQKSRLNLNTKSTLYGALLHFQLRLLYLFLLGVLLEGKF